MKWNVQTEKGIGGGGGHENIANYELIVQMMTRKRRHAFGTPNGRRRKELLLNCYKLPELTCHVDDD